MFDPLYSLIIGTVIILALGYFFWPESGILAKWLKGSVSRHREELEDTLKHLFDMEYNNNTATLNSLAKKLEVSDEYAKNLYLQLMKKGLADQFDDRFKLTTEGKEYAIRIVRTHRLWERYLADETSVHANDWHTQAEEMEHKLSANEVETLAASLGNPIVDPHGDPIPTYKGEMPASRGVELTSLTKGSVARITHIEDEPAAVFAQFMAMGLYKGMQVEILNMDDKKIEFFANGEKLVLAKPLAENITVKVIKNDNEIIDNFTKLSSLKQGETGVVKGISKALRGQQRRRLMDLGVVPGSKILAELESNSGNPVAYRIRGASIALRKQHSDLIYIEPLNGGNNG